MMVTPLELRLDGLAKWQDENESITTKPGTPGWNELGGGRRPKFEDLAMPSRVKLW